MTTLITWLGDKDLKILEDSSFAGPIIILLDKHTDLKYDNALIISDYSTDQNEAYLKLLTNRFPKQAITIKQVQLNNPSNISELYPLVTDILDTLISNDKNHQCNFIFNLSSGTRQMTFLWELFTLTRLYRGEMFQSFYKDGQAKIEKVAVTCHNSDPLVIGILTP